MSEQDNTIRALQIQCATNAKKLDQLRAANKKLRAELACAQRSCATIKSASLANWETAERYRRDVAEAVNIGKAWKEAFSKLSKSIGGKAK